MTTKEAFLADLRNLRADGSNAPEDIILHRALDYIEKLEREQAEHRYHQDLYRRTGRGYAILLTLDGLELWLARAPVEADGEPKRLILRPCKTNTPRSFNPGFCDPSEKQPTSFRRYRLRSVTAYGAAVYEEFTE